MLDYPLLLRIPPHSNGYISFFLYFQATTIIAKADGEFKMYIGDLRNVPSSKTNNLYDADSNLASTPRMKRVYFEESMSNLDKDKLYGTIENVKLKSKYFSVLFCFASCFANNKHTFSSCQILRSALK